MVHIKGLNIKKKTRNIINVIKNIGTKYYLFFRLLTDYIKKLSTVFF